MKSTNARTQSDLAYADGYYDGLRHGKQSKQRELTIGEIIDRGWIDCPKCNSRRAVGGEGDARGMVSGCSNCGDSGYWNLFVEAL